MEPEVQERRGSKVDCTRWNPQSQANEVKNDVVLKFLDALISANIPLEKVDNPKLRTFLQTHVRNGGSVPGSVALRRRLPELFQKHEANLIAMFQGTTVSVIIDETIDDRSKSVVNVSFVQSARMANVALQPVLVEVKFVDEVNSSGIGRIVTRTLTSTLQASFPFVNKFVACVKKAFRLSSRKRAFYKSHLEECEVQCAKASSAPAQSRWNSWIEAVEQHYAYFEHYPSLLQQVHQKYDEAACVDSLLKLLSEDSTELRDGAAYSHPLSIALKYLAIPINSVDAERSFSHYGDIFSHKRHFLSEESTKHHLMLCQNSFL
ncbi:hypothetical protein HPB51_008377 [Rhipicephalus microplus]|uniref:HAT C-terminal dimerisation domain-containing protein n=1 Tax=Rhipicephalus microplus TaxID=6941 RepID=A0A9J6DU34_RHIMP|nr:hypothetical protein HPB51_008377 [Rhipicephalus microplus]